MPNDLTCLIARHHLSQGRVSRHAPRPPHQKGQHGHGQHDGEPDADVETVHRVGQKVSRTSILLAGKHVAHATHRQYAFGRLGVDFNGRPDAAHVHVDGAVKGV